MLGYTLGRTKYRLRVLYRSGNEATFWVYSFTIKSGAKVEWYAVSQSNKPLEIGLDDIEAVYQVGAKRTVWPFYSMK